LLTDAGPNCINLFVPIIVLNVNLEAVGHCWGGYLIARIADRARHSGAAAVAGAVA